MLEISLIVAGLVLLTMASALPHKSSTSLRRGFRWWASFSSLRRNKLRLDLPHSAEFMWTCRIYPSKVPMVLNERTEINLVVTPMIGHRGKADIEIPISSTDQLKDLSLKIVAPSFDMQTVGSPIQLALSEPSEATYLLLPKYIGKHTVRFEFWYREERRGRAEAEFAIRSRQYGVTLPAPLVLILTVAGLLASGAGVVLGIVKILR